MPSAFTPQSIPNWPGKRAVLLVHGIGDASAAGTDAFPIAPLKSALGDDAESFAIYTLNYDFINDWAEAKTNVAAGLAALKNAIAKKFGGDALAETIAEYAGDIFWPVLNADIRLAVRDAFIAQADQIMLDCAETALANGDDPLDYQVSIIAHSLGCFHAYETLSATVADPQYHMRPGTDLTRLQAVFLMASPVQLIRAVGGDIRLTVPDIESLATLSKPLAVPAEQMGTKKITCARRFISVVGDRDPVGGYLLGKKQTWAYMELGGQEAVIDPQRLIGADETIALTAALHGNIANTVKVGARRRVQRRRECFQPARLGGVRRTAHHAAARGAPLMNAFVRTLGCRAVSHARSANFTVQRNTRRRTLFATTLRCALASATVPLYAHAQTAPVINNDERLLARADSITVGDYCHAARAVLGAATVQTALATDAQSAELSATLICAPSLTRISLRALRGDQPASLASVARIHADSYRELSRNTFAAMENFRTLTRGDELRPIVRAALGDSANTALVRATETANALIVREARDAALVRLAHYERKLGPTSARLNAVEVLLNYGAQRFVPGFTATPSRGPSPWEVVAAYVPTYGTYANKKLQAVSVSEFGIRHYNFGEQYGAAGWKGVLLPTYWSAGAIVVSDHNGALVWPWQDKQRTGAFLSWGALKIAYAHGRQGQLLLSRQFQIIPLVF